jgi:CBS domain containing-hemolysin-like protein
MLDIIASILLLFLAICFVVLRKTYNYLPVRELKRRAEKHDPLASTLYSAVAYGSSLRELLLLCIILSSGGGFVLLMRVTPIWFSFVVVVVVLWLAFSWLPVSRVTSFGARLTVLVTPTVTWVLSHLFPLLNRSADAIEKRRSATAHTGIFERSDLIALIEQQQQQDDNRLSLEALEILKHTLMFDDFKVVDSLTPAKQIKIVLAHDVIGPVLINELHEHGQDFVLVRESPKGAIVGTLAFKHLDLKTTGHVRDVMDTRVYYLHEADSLTDALHAFFVTNYPLFVVVNTAEEYVGIITVQDILRELLGHMPGDDFDQYGDLNAVASRHAKKAASEPPEEDGIVHNTEEVVE